MANLKLKKQKIEAVDNQLKANDPPFVKEVYQKLQEEGSSKKEAKEMIASVLLDDEEDFLEDILDYVNDGEEDEILKVKHQVYDALYEHKPTEAVRIFLTVWEDIKKFVKDNFYKQDKNGNIIKPEVIDIDDQTDFKYELFNWLQDMEMEFQNSGLFEESIAYFHDVIDLFAWVEDSCDYYKAAIGEVYNKMKNYEECDNYFESWLESEPDNIACINIYTLCMIMRGEETKAQELVEKYIPITMELNIENEVLFHRAIDVYSRTGDEQKRDEYQNVLESYLDKQENYRYPDYSFRKELPIVKDKKVYPNDPCPCGSGKKYKKCCGK